MKMVPLLRCDAMRCCGDANHTGTRSVSRCQSRQIAQAGRAVAFAAAVQLELQGATVALERLASTGLDLSAG